MRKSSFPHVRVQSRPHIAAENRGPAAPKAACHLPSVLAAVHAWVALKAACGHSRPFFGDGPASLPVEPVAPILPILPGMVEVAL